MNDSYSRKYEKWDKELKDSVPRKTVLKLGAIFLLLVLFVFVGFLLYALSHFVSTALMPDRHLPTQIFFSILALPVSAVFLYVANWERIAVRDWKKVIGHLKDIKSRETTRGRSYKVFDIGYEYGGGAVFKSKRRWRRASEGCPSRRSGCFARKSRKSECLSFIL